MQKIKLFYLLISCLIVLYIPTNAQEVSFNYVLGDSVLRYYPLAIGNKWVYRRTTQFGGNPTVVYYAEEVMSYDLLPNGKRYFKINTYYDRIDSSKGNVFRYKVDPNLPEDEYLISNLAAEVGDTIFGIPNPVPILKVIEQGWFTEWGLNKHKKRYKVWSISTDDWETFTYAHSLGIIHKDWAVLFVGSSNTFLLGCVIDGIVYGDTTLVSVNLEQQKPITYSVSQNYPNPFNPTTKIKYQIPEISFVTLKVYDVLGNEIATLVNEEKPAGEYEVEFNGSDLPSGIYFYQLRAGQFVETKKMVLIK